MDASDRHRDHGRPESEIYKTLTPMPEPLVSPRLRFLITPGPISLNTSGLRGLVKDITDLAISMSRAPVFVEHWRYSCRQQCDYRRRPPAQHRSHHRACSQAILDSGCQVETPADSYTPLSRMPSPPTRRCDGDRQPHSIRSERYKNQ
jgi:hypothetical protein